MTTLASKLKEMGIHLQDITKVHQRYDEVKESINTTVYEDGVVVAMLYEENCTIMPVREYGRIRQFKERDSFFDIESQIFVNMFAEYTCHRYYEQAITFDFHESLHMPTGLRNKFNGWRGVSDEFADDLRRKYDPMYGVK